MVEQVTAEVIAAQVLAWIAADADLLDIFLGSTGLSTDAFDTADTPEFLASVLDFLLMDEAWVTRFCDVSDLGYDAPMKARAALPGGEIINWT